jgi:hypothetical protein
MMIVFRIPGQWLQIDLSIFFGVPKDKVFLERMWIVVLVKG